MDIKVTSQGRHADLNFVQNNKDVSNEVSAKSNESINKSEYTKQDLDRAVSKLNRFLEGDKTHAEYQVHDKLNTVMIKIVDDKTKEVIMELPPQKILDMVAKMCELVGVVFDKEA